MSKEISEEEDRMALAIAMVASALVETQDSGGVIDRCTKIYMKLRETDTDNAVALQALQYLRDSFEHMR